MKKLSAFFLASLLSLSFAVCAMAAVSGVNDTGKMDTANKNATSKVVNKIDDIGNNSSMDKGTAGNMGTGTIGTGAPDPDGSHAGADSSGGEHGGHDGGGGGHGR